MQIEEDIKLLNQYIKDHQHILCLSIKKRKGAFLYPICEIYKFGNCITTQHMYIDTKSVYDMNYLGGCVIEIEEELSLVKTIVNENKTVFTYGNYEFILFK